MGEKLEKEENEDQKVEADKEVNMSLYHFLLSTASPNPGVSTTVRRNLTPFSSMSTVVASIVTVCLMRSVE